MNNEMYHYGVKGMKWGVRRAKPSKPSRKQQIANTRKEMKNMSDKELRDRINRLQMENQYMSLKTPKQSKGAKFAKEILGNPAKQAATVVVGMYVKKGMEYAIKQGAKHVRAS